jgi:hypothetical protein
MNEAILLILADAFECSAREEGEESRSPCDYHAGRSDAYHDVAARLRRIIEGASTSEATPA